MELSDLLPDASRIYHRHTLRLHKTTDQLHVNVKYLTSLNAHTHTRLRLPQDACENERPIVVKGTERARKKRKIQVTNPPIA